MGQSGSKDVLPKLYHHPYDYNDENENDDHVVDDYGIAGTIETGPTTTTRTTTQVVSKKNDGGEEEKDDDDDDYYYETIDDEGQARYFGNDDVNPDLVSIPDGDDDNNNNSNSNIIPHHHHPSGNTMRNRRTRSSGNNNNNSNNNNSNNNRAIISAVADHFTMGDSTTLRFRSRLLRIFDNGSSHQLILEQNPPMSSIKTTKQRTTSQVMMIRRRVLLQLQQQGGWSETVGLEDGPKEEEEGYDDDNDGNAPGAITKSSISTTTTTTPTSLPPSGPPSTTTSDSRTQKATIHLTNTANFGMAFLRTVYTLVALFVMTVLFCFTVQVILFLFMNIVGVETPETWTANPPTMSVVGATLAVPLLLYSGGSMMSMSWSFVVDCWRGISNEQSSLFRQMVFWNETITEWVCFIIFLLIPLVTLSISTLSKNDNWWEYTIASWAISVGSFQLFYMLLAFMNEVNMCWALLHKFLLPNHNNSNNNNNNDDDDDANNNNNDDNDNNNDQRQQQRRSIPEWVKMAQMNILLTQRQKWSGYRYERYIVEGNDIPPPLGYSSDPRYVPVQWSLRWGTRMTLYWCKSKRTTDDNNNDTKKNDWYTVLRPPVRNYSMDEVFGNVMIMTNRNWSLERLWCMDRKRSAAITLSGVGPSSVTSEQMMNGYICIVAGSLLLLLAVGGLLAWASLSAAATFIILLLVFVFCLFPMNYSSYLVYRFHRRMVASEVREEGQREDTIIPPDGTTNVVAEQATTTTPEGVVRAGTEQLQSTVLNNDDNDNTKNIKDNNTTSNRGVTFSLSSMVRKKSAQPNDATTTSDKALISVWESVRVSEAQPWLCWTTFTLEVIIFFLWPLLSLSVNGNGPVAIVFSISGIFSIIRHYFNVTNLFHELGPITDLDITSTDLEPAFHGLVGGGLTNNNRKSRSQYERDRTLKNQALIAGIVKRVTRTNATKNWIVVFFLLFLCVFAGFIMASTEDAFDYRVKGVIFVNDFYYEPQPQLPYPTCSVQKGFTFPGMAGSAASLADYAFLATQAFSGPEEAQPNLDQWFGPGLVIDEYQFVDQYRNETGTANNPVSYKLFTFPSIPNAGIVSIRGSESMWDWMVDIQLWAGGVLAQLIRNINPFGFIWESILDDVVLFINSVQSQKLKDVSYYRYTSQFVLDMYGGYDGRQYDEMRVTGASLGGGLAILTGAITGASTVAISGLNAMYSRRTFDPPITADQLNTRVFNVIPARDIIAHIDRPGDLYQRTQCRASQNSLFGCHSMWRNLCELQYQCGSGTRPINCWCVSKYGYPAPIQNGTLTWEEACADSEE